MDGRHPQLVICLLVSSVGSRAALIPSYSNASHDGQKYNELSLNAFGSLLNVGSASYNIDLNQIILTML